jgi:cytochrome c551/c552
MIFALHTTNLFYKGTQMKTISVVVAAVALIAAGSAMAGDELLKKDGCMACHNGKIGPTFKDVNAVTKGDVAIVTATLEKGAKTGKYAGIKMAMPPQATHKADAAALAKEIASQK